MGWPRPSGAMPLMPLTHACTRPTELHGLMATPTTFYVLNHTSALWAPQPPPPRPQAIQHAAAQPIRPGFEAPVEDEHGNCNTSTIWISRYWQHTEQPTSGVCRAQVAQAIRRHAADTHMHQAPRNGQHSHQQHEYAGAAILSATAMLTPTAMASTSTRHPCSRRLPNRRADPCLAHPAVQRCVAHPELGTQSSPRAQPELGTLPSFLPPCTTNNVLQHDCRTLQIEQRHPHDHQHHQHHHADACAARHASVQCSHHSLRCTPVGCAAHISNCLLFAAAAALTLPAQHAHNRCPSAQ
jgi:hypothetical protein